MITIIFIIIGILVLIFLLTFVGETDYKTPYEKMLAEQETRRLRGQMSLIVRTKEEQAEQDRKDKEAEKEERFNSAKRRYEKECRPWYKKIF